MSGAVSAAPMPVSTPCRRLCALDARVGLCTGCGRSLAEIAAWGRLSEAERRRIMARLAAGPPAKGA